MQIFTSPNWNDYELLDSGNGKRLERFGKHILVRPDPQAIWKPALDHAHWHNVDAVFKRTHADEGKWVKKTQLPDKWLMRYKHLSFWIKLTPFKHTGVFPEQAVQWEFIHSVISSRLSVISNQVNRFSVSQTERLKTGEPVAENRKQKTDNRPNILNLFAYTGVASLAAAAAGAKVTHVDASKPAITWARENQKVSQLSDKPMRWIVDDAIKFCQREVKREVKYDSIIMDPPIYGHGPKGETWKFSEDFPKLLHICRQLLSDTPLFILVNTYANSSSAFMLKNVMQDYFGDLNGAIDCGELTLQEKSKKRLLSTGIFGIWNYS